MSYVLVSLVSEGDEGSQATDALARWYANKYPPAERFHEELPKHDAVVAAVVALESRRGFVLGHGGGGTLRPVRGGRILSPDFPLEQSLVWVDSAQFAQVFKGARVYVFACSTLAEKDVAGQAKSFGRAAVDLGVAVYAGHFKTIEAPNDPENDLHSQQLRRAIVRVVNTFLNGCDDVARLLIEARSANSRKARVPLKVAPNQLKDSEVSVIHSLEWQRIFGSLKIELPTR